MNYLELYNNSNFFTKVIIWLFILCFGFFISRLYNIENKIKQLTVIVFLSVCAYFTIYFFTNIDLKTFSIIYLLPSFFWSLVFFLIFRLISFKIKKNRSDLVIDIPFKNGREITVDLVKGLSVQGAAGSGKTLSFCGWLLYSLGKKNVGGVVYDYKDMELVEMVNYFYRKSDVPVYIFAPYDPQKSIQFNPLDINLIKSHEDIKIMSKCIMTNVLGKAEGNSKFFYDAAEGAITGVIYTLKEFYSQFCSFTYLTAIFLTKDTDELVDFIKKSMLGSVHARAFLDSQDSSKQMAAVKSTISNAFSVFANPNIFYTLSKNSEDFSINEKHNKSVLCVVNKPKYDDIYSPILSVVMQSLIIKMSARDREKCFVLLDEAPTLNINRLGKVPATMRSFGVSTIYMLQDKIQAQVQIGIDRMKEIFANLSTTAIGKTNDPDTAKHFEAYFEEIDTKQRSVSFKSGGNDKRTSVSNKKEKKHKSYEMFKRDTGEFFIFDNKGRCHDGKIKKIKYNPSEVMPTSTISPLELERFYKEVLIRAKDLGSKY